MAWKYIDKSFPLGKVRMSDGSYFDNEYFKESEIKTIVIPLTLDSGNIIKEKRKYIWSD